MSADDVAARRYRNALALFDEFVAQTVKHPDAATLRGLERRFAERLAIQPSYWSQIKNRSRQIGERLARQFEQRCHKPPGWLDLAHGPAAIPTGLPPTSAEPPLGQAQDDDERFIVALVLSYYRRHPQRARARLLELVGELLGEPPTAVPPPRPPAAPPTPTAPPVPAPTAHDLWLDSQRGVAPLKRKR